MAKSLSYKSPTPLHSLRIDPPSSPQQPPNGLALGLPMPMSKCHHQVCTLAKSVSVLSDTFMNVTVYAIVMTVRVSPKKGTFWSEILHKIEYIVLTNRFAP
jgi:hypothetical protein